MKLINKDRLMGFVVGLILGTAITVYAATSNMVLWSKLTEQETGVAANPLVCATN